MKKSVLVTASLLLFTVAAGPVGPLYAQGMAAEAQPSFASYSAALQAGEKLFGDRKYKDARTAYESALSLAKTDDERAEAFFGAARTHEKELVIREVRSGKFATRRESFTDYEAARRKYGEVEKLPGLSSEKKADARVALANTYALAGARTEAREQFTKLLDAGLPPAARATALVGRAESYLNGVLASSSDVTLAMADLELALKVEGIRDPQKADALLRLSELYFRTLNKSQVPANLAAVISLPGATGAQKAKAYLMSGNLHHLNKDTEKARAAWSQIPLLPGVAADQKVLAHRNVAQTYLTEKKIEEAQGELEKAAQLPELTVFEKAALYEDMGDIYLAAANYAAARSAFARIVALPDAGPLRHKDARIKTGQAFEKEKNYAAARETWENLAGGKDVGATEALRLIAISYVTEKDYPAARAVFERWLAVPVASYWKEDAWLLMGQVYEREMNWTAARDAYGKLGQDPKARNTRKVHAVLGVARTYQAEKNEEAVLQAYATLPAAFKVEDQISPAEQSELNQMRTALLEQLKKLAAARSQDKDKLPQAVSLLRTAEGISFIRTAKATVLLQLANLYFAHGMLAEAKVEYQKVVQDGFTAEQQQARQKLKEIEEKEKAAAGAAG